MNSILLPFIYAVLLSFAWLYSWFLTVALWRLKKEIKPMVTDTTTPAVTYKTIRMTKNLYSQGNKHGKMDE